MTKFDWKDFTKSAASLAGGMSVVIAIVYWHSGFNWNTITLTAGLPIGVICFWGIYALKMKLFEAGRPKALPPLSAQRSEEFSSFRRPEGSFERRTLKVKTADYTRLRILQGRPVLQTQEPEHLDQWHQS